MQSQFGQTSVDQQLTMAPGEDPRTQQQHTAPEPPAEASADAADAAMYSHLALAAYDDATAAAGGSLPPPPPRQRAFFAALRQLLRQVLEETTPAGRHTRLLAANHFFVSHQPRAQASDGAAAAAMAASLSVPGPAGATAVAAQTGLTGTTSEQHRSRAQLASSSRETTCLSADAEWNSSSSNAARCHRWEQQGAGCASADADDPPAAAGNTAAAASALPPRPPDPAVPLVVHPSVCTAPCRHATSRCAHCRSAPAAAAAAAGVDAAPCCSSSSASWQDLAAAQQALVHDVETQLHMHAVHAARLQEAAWRQAGAAVPQPGAGGQAADRLLLHLDSQHRPSTVAAGAAAQLLGASDGGGSAGALLAALAGHAPLQRARQQLMQESQRECASLAARLAVSEAALARALLPPPDVPYASALARLPQPVGAAAAAAGAAGGRRKQAKARVRA